MSRHALAIALILAAMPAILSAQDSDDDAPAELAPATEAKCLAILRGGLRSIDGGEDSFWPAIHAAEGLTLAGRGEEVVAFLQERLPQQRDDQKRCGLARELVRAGQTDAAGVMADILRSPDDYGHVHAAESLYKVGGIGDAEAMRAAARREDNPKLVLMALAALAKVENDTAALDSIRERLAPGTPEQELRIAAWLLGRIGDESDIARLRAALEGDFEDPVVPAVIELALATLGADDGTDLLRKHLASGDPAIRTYAATFAGDAGATGLFPELIALLDDSHPDAAIRAAQSLLYLSRPEAD